MYKLKKEYKGQDVIVYMPDHSVIKLETATDKELEKAFKQKGNEKFIEIDKRYKESKTNLSGSIDASSTNTATISKDKKPVVNKTVKK